MCFKLPLPAIFLFALFLISCQTGNGSAKTGEPDDNKTEVVAKTDGEPSKTVEEGAPTKADAGDPEIKKPDPATNGSNPVNGGDTEGAVKTDNPEGVTKPEEAGVKEDTPEAPVKIIERVEIREVPVQIRPMTMPEAGSEMWKELLASASHETLMKLLDDKARALGRELPLPQRMALISSYLALYVGDPVTNEAYLDAADSLFDEIKGRPDLDKTWSLQTSALIRQHSGSPADAIHAASDLRDAYRMALRAVPLQIHQGYHCLSSVDDRGMRQRRMLSKDKRENKVYRSGDTMQLAIIFSYLNGTHDLTKEEWSYVVTVAAELYEKDETAEFNLGRKVPEFRQRDLHLPFVSSHSPDERESVYLKYSLPADIKSEADYILVVTIGDGKREGETETVYIDVKIRYELPD